MSREKRVLLDQEMEAALVHLGQTTGRASHRRRGPWSVFNQRHLTEQCNRTGLLLSEFWRDALGGEFRCTQAGTPGTWLQIRPPAVTADPSSGTIPVGYWVWNVTSGLLKRHAGGYVWEGAGA